jgi:hypothetical protein
VSDGANSTTQNITVNVTNVNDNSPSFSSSATLSMTENTTAIGSVIATDADGDSITFSISGTNADAMTINSINGVLTFNSAPDYETKSSYSVIATATDGINSTTQNISIDVVDDAMFVASQDNSGSTGSTQISDGGFNIDFADNAGGTKDTYTMAVGEPYYDEWLSGEGRYQENVGRAYGYRYDNSTRHSSSFLEESDENWEWGTRRGIDVAVADSGNGKMLSVVGVPGGNYPYSDVSLHLADDDGSVFGENCTINLEDIDGVSDKLYRDSSGQHVAISGDGRTIALGDTSNNQIHFLLNTNADPYSCNAIDPSINSNWTLLNSLEANLNGYFDDGGRWGFKLSHNGLIFLSLDHNTTSSAATMNVFMRDNIGDNTWTKYNPLTQDSTLNVTNSPFLWAGRDSIDMNSDGTIFAVGSSDGNVHYVTFNSSLYPSIVSFKTNGAERRSDINTRTRSSIRAVEFNQDGSIIAIGRDSGCVDIQKNIGNAVFEFYGEICSQVNATSIDNIEFNSDMTRIHWTGQNANGRIYERYYLTEVNN